MNMRKQRLIGALLVIISGIVIVIAFLGTSPEDRDVTFVLFTLPLGLYMIFTKEYIFYDGFNDMDSPEDEVVPEDPPTRDTTHF